jgi:ABC-type transporter Mla subunit MlaD
MPFKITDQAAEVIRTTLAALATAEGVLQTAENALNEKQEQCRADVEEIEVLKKTLSPEDARGIQKLTVLRN